MLHLDLAWQKYSISVKKYQTPFKKFLFVDLCNESNIKFFNVIKKSLRGIIKYAKIATAEVNNVTLFETIARPTSKGKYIQSLR